MAARITIRQATVDDLPWVRHLIAKFMADPKQVQGYPTFDVEELDAFTVAAYRALAHNPAFRSWLAWRGKTAIGCLAGEIQSRLVGKPHRYVNALWAYVEPEYRAGDVGFRMLDAMAVWAEHEGIDTMECRATAGDTRYADHGYPLVATDYAAPIALVRDRWRQHAEKTDAPKTNGHDTTVEALTA
jgi:GNAT superfamily N-acetyltransferase